MQAYITNLNGALDKFPELKTLGLVDLNKAVGTDAIPKDVATVVRNNGGGHWNHSFFWKVCAGTVTQRSGIYALGWARLCLLALGLFQNVKTLTAMWLWRDDLRLDTTMAPIARPFSNTVKGGWDAWIMRNCCGVLAGALVHVSQCLLAGPRH